MRALELHAPMRSVKRSEGRSSVQMSAYITRTSMEDERTGERHDFRDKGGVEFTGLLADENAPEWAFDRRKLWNNVERTNKRKDAQVAREIEISMPHEFNAAQRREASMKIAQALIDRYGGAVEFAIHEPGERGDTRNWHTHLLFSTRRFDSNGEWAAKGRMEGKKFIYSSPLDHPKTSGPELESLRAQIAGIQNDIAARDRLEVHVENLSYAKRGMDKEPQQHMGKNATALERRGEVSDIGAKNREIRGRNEERAQFQQELKENVIEFDRERAKRGSQQPFPALQTQNERQDAFTRETYDRRVAMVDAFENEYGAREKQLQREAARLAGSLDKAGLVARLWRRISGRTRQDREALDKTRTDLQAIARQRESLQKAFERDRVERLEMLKAEWLREEQECARMLAQAVGDTVRRSDTRSIPPPSAYDRDKATYFKRIQRRSENPRPEPTRAENDAEKPATSEYDKTRREYFRKLGAKRKSEREPVTSPRERKSREIDRPPTPTNEFRHAAEGETEEALQDELKRAHEANPLNLTEEERAARGIETEPPSSSPEASQPSEFEPLREAYLRRAERNHGQKNDPTPDRGPDRER